jgi:hypothetical protein
VVGRACSCVVTGIRACVPVCPCLSVCLCAHSANGDGYVSIPEFSAYMTGNTNTFDALRSAKAIEEAEPPPSRGMMPAMTRSMQQLAFEGDAHEGQRSWGAGAKPLTWRDRLFMDRMSNDLEDRRRTQFINELKKDPRFKPSMLEPPKPKFKEVSLTNGPIVKSHDRKRTGLETKKPYQWGPLGGWY